MKKILKKYAQNIKSDLACEFIKPKKCRNDDVLKVYEVVLDETLAEKIEKKPGRYISIDTKVVFNGEIDNYDRVCMALKDELKPFIEGNNILIVGLGNYRLEADSLGVKACGLIEPTRNIISAKYNVSIITPGVVGSTGIESFEVVKGISSIIQPDTIIVIDSLCASSISRLLTTFQITNAGITPGSGVNNHRMSLNKETLNANVVSIGIPTVVHASTLVKEFEGKPFKDNLVVSPKDIDFAIKDCAKIISTALNSIFLESIHFD